MYLEYYGLNEKPFALTPNPRFIFYSEQYREAEEQLIYGVSQKEGFMVVTGTPGAGKTTLCRDLLEKLDPHRYRSALLFNPFIGGADILRGLLSDFRVGEPPADASRKDLLDRLNNFLIDQLRAGRTCVAIFDEAQHLSSESLEQIRVLSNLETDQEKLIQIILVGQPELLEKIKSPSMAQLDQRVSVRCRLVDLSQEQTQRYIYHRLNVAGAQGAVELTPRALEDVYRASKGVPRMINLICDRALLAGFAAQVKRIDREHVAQAVDSLQGDDAVTAVPAPIGAAGSPRKYAIAAGIAALAIATGFWGGRGFFAWADQRSPSAVAVPSDSIRNLRTADSLLASAQKAMIRGDRAGALGTVGVLRTRFATSAVRSDAEYLAARIHFDRGALVEGCRATAEAQRTVGSDSTMRDELDLLAARCVGLEGVPYPAEASTKYGAHLAVFDSLPQAAPLRAQLSQAGLSDAVVPCGRRLCIRVGMFSTRAEAERLVAELAKKKIGSTVVGWSAQ